MEPFQSEIRITRSAQKRIRKLAERCPIETGGLLAGIADPPTITAAGEPGPGAVRTAASYSGDVETDRRELAAARRRFGESVVIVGYWHKHPDGMGRFSGQDLRQARELDEAFGDGNGLVVLIIERSGRRQALRLHAYGLQSNDKQLTARKLTVVDDEAECVRQALAGAPVLPDTDEGGFWEEASFQFYANPVGRQRIRQELAALRKAGWVVTTTRPRGQRGLVVECKRGGEAIQLRFPAEFPVNPPRAHVFGGRRRVVGLRAVREWNSDGSLAELLTECCQVLACDRCRRRHLKVCS